MFIAATNDRRFRAFDKDTGELVWEYRLPASAHATPMTYMVDGKLYIALAVGGGNKYTRAASWPRSWRSDSRSRLAPRFPRPAGLRPDRERRDLPAQIKGSWQSNTGPGLTDRIPFPKRGVPNAGPDSERPQDCTHPRPSCERHPDPVQGGWRARVRPEDHGAADQQRGYHRVPQEHEISGPEMDAVGSEREPADGLDRRSHAPGEAEESSGDRRDVQRTHPGLRRDHGKPERDARTARPQADHSGGLPRRWPGHRCPGSTPRGSGQRSRMHQGTER